MAKTNTLVYRTVEEQRRLEIELREQAEAAQLAAIERRIADDARKAAQQAAWEAEKERRGALAVEAERARKEASLKSVARLRFLRAGGTESMFAAEWPSIFRDILAAEALGKPTFKPDMSKVFRVRL